MAFNREAATAQAALRRRILITAMGSQCMECGTTEQLEFHHTEHRQWVASRLNQWTRQAKYEQDWEAGVLELLCRSCNARAGAPL